MKIMRYILAVISIFTYFYFFNYHSPYYVRLADKITDNTAKELRKEKNLHLIGTGGGMMDDIQMMAMSFQYYQEVDIKQARNLIVHATNKYLSEINNNEKIRTYLHEYPFTEKNVEIRIWFQNPDGTKLPLDKIYYVSAIEGELN